MKNIYYVTVKKPNDVKTYVDLVDSIKHFIQHNEVRMKCTETPYELQYNMKCGAETFYNFYAMIIDSGNSVIASGSLDDSIETNETKYLMDWYQNVNPAYDNGDLEDAHCMADDILCSIAEDIGYKEIVRLFRDMHKYYS